MDIFSIVIAGLALILSCVTVLIQINVYSQEWRPMLSFTACNVWAQIDKNKRSITQHYDLVLRNVNKCVNVNEFLYLSG